MVEKENLNKLGLVGKVIFSLFLGIILLEVGLRLTGVFKVYSEKLGREYTTYYDYWHEGHYKILPPNQEINYRQNEISATFKTNSFGMRNPRIEINPPDSVIRILCLGDSYTEGDGASSGMEYPRQLETLLNSRNDLLAFEVLNGGRNGSDVLYAEKILTKEFYKLSPNIVILCINETDIDDIIQRGGLERFKNTGITRYKSSPSYHDLYKKYHVFRFYIHMFLGKDYLFLKKKERIKETEKALKIISNSIDRLKEFCEDRDIQLLTIIHPTPHSKVSKKSNNQKKFIQEYCDNNRLRPLVLQNNVNDICYSLLDTLSKLPYTEYAWPINGHFNDFGYKIMSEEILMILDGSIRKF
jgi:hypothetical protein